MRAASGHGHLIEWVRRHCLFVPIDRTSGWGNPYVIGRDGNRDDVLAAHARHLADLLARLRRRELAHRVLGWYAPTSCHGHTLAALTLEHDLDPLAALRTRPPRPA
ncbi:DUF4326 domain-containing protein [Nocardia sp. R7R-8]|uniref:DUF4326 domain-containing protein n=1 Tax=Nocardia sp. R7R-8 TaxID=3459304 RepID=UPI00403E1034